MSIHDTENELIFESYNTKVINEDRAYRVEDFVTYNGQELVVTEVDGDTLVLDDPNNMGSPFEVSISELEQNNAEYNNAQNEKYDELFNLAKDYYSANSKVVKDLTEREIKNTINSMMNSANEESFDGIIGLRDQIYHIMQVGTPDQDDFNAENDYERRMEQYGRERGY